MDPLVQLLNDASRWWLGHAAGMAWQAAIVVAVLLAFDLVLARRSRAVVRHALWLLVLLKLLLPTGLALPTSPWYWRPVADEERRPARAAVDPRILTGLATDDSTGFGLAEPAGRSPNRGVLRPGISREGWVFMLWLGGSGLLAAFFTRRTLQVRRVVVAARPASAAVRSLFISSANRLGLRRLPRLAVSDELATPSVCGLARPVVLFPRGLAERLDEPRLEDVLLHELAHVRRGDLWWSHLQALLLVIYWWHPLVWVAHLRLRALTEEATDEAVVVVRRGDPSGYAETLIDVARAAIHRPLISLGLMGILEGRRSLRRRIERLTTCPVPATSRIGVVGWFGLALMAALLLPMARGGVGPSPEITSDSAIRGATNPAVTEASDATLSPLVQGRPIAYETAEPRPEGNPFAAPPADRREVGQARLRTKLEALRLEEMAFPGIALQKVVRWLIEQSKRADTNGDGVNIFLNPNLDVVGSGTPAIDPLTGTATVNPSIAPSTLGEVIIRIDPPIKNVRVVDALDAITRAAARPIHFTIEDYAVVFADGPAKPRLLTRVFRVNPQAFEEGLRSAMSGAEGDGEAPADAPTVSLEPIEPAGLARGAGIPPAAAAVQRRVRTFFEMAGVRLAPPNAVFFNDRLGLLMVRATVPEMEIVEKALEVLNAAPPMIQIEVRFLEIPDARLRELDLDLESLALRVGHEPVPSILAPERVTALLAALGQLPDIRTVASPRITTLSRRQARVGVEIAAPTNAAAGAVPPAVGTEPSAVSVDVLPDVRADGRTIEMTVSAELTEVGVVTPSGAGTGQGGDVSEPAGTVFAVRAMGFVRHRLSGVTAVPDGHTVVMASAGVLGASPGTDRPARRLVLLVTPTLIDPAGNPLHPPSSPTRP